MPETSLDKGKGAHHESGHATGRDRDGSAHADGHHRGDDHRDKTNEKNARGEHRQLPKASGEATTTKAEQENELSGEYKFIDQMLSDLQAIARQEEEYRQAAEAGKITIEGNSEKDG